MFKFKVNQHKKIIQELKTELQNRETLTNMFKADILEKQREIEYYKNEIKNKEDLLDKLKQLCRDHIPDTFYYIADYLPQIEKYHLRIYRQHVESDVWGNITVGKLDKDYITIKNKYFKTIGEAKKYAETTISKLTTKYEGNK